MDLCIASPTGRSLWSPPCRITGIFFSTCSARLRYSISGTLGAPTGASFGGMGEKLWRGQEMNMSDVSGLVLAICWMQRALISAFQDNCPLRPITKGKKSLTWNWELELLKKEVHPSPLHR